MLLRLILGRAKTGKTQKIIDEMKTSKNCIYIVPEQYSYQAEKKIIKSEGALGLFGTQVYSLRRLYFFLVNYYGGKNRTYLDPISKTMIISSILINENENLKIYKDLANVDGFSQEVRKAIDEFKAYNITPQVLKGAKEVVDSSLLQKKLEDLGLIFEKFEEFIKKGYIDPSDELTILAGLINNTPYFEGKKIYFDQFSSFSPQEEGVIGAMLKKGDEVVIALTHDEDGDEFILTNKTANKLKKLAQRMGVEVKEERLYDTHFKSEEIKVLEREYYNYPKNTYKEKTKDIKIIAAKDPYDEVQAAAREIVSLVRDEGFNFSDIAIVSRDLSIYERFLKSEFQRFEIPLFLDKKVRVLSHPVVLFILSAFDILLTNFSYDSVFTYLKCGFSDLRDDEIFILENYCLATNIKGATWTNGQKWDMRMGLYFDSLDMNEGEKEVIDLVNAAREKFIRPVVNLKNAVSGKKSAKEFAHAIYSFLEELDLYNKVLKKAQKFMESGQVDLASEYTQIYNIFINTLDTLADSIVDRKYNFEQIAKILRGALSEVEIGLIPLSLDSVLAGNLDRSRAAEAKVLFLLGVNDGIFPAISSGSGLLTDQDKLALEEAHIELSPKVRDKAYMEEHLVYNAITIADSKLYLSYSVSDSAQRALRPSRIISGVKEIFPQVEFYDFTLDGLDFKKISNKSGTYPQLIENLRKRYDGKKISPVWDEVYAFFKKDEEYKEKLNSALENFKRKNQAEKIKKEILDKMYEGGVTTSVSRLESYNRCPFSYYVNYMLKAKPKKKAQITGVDVGTLIHEVISRFSIGLKKENKNWREIDEEYIDKKVDEIIDELYAFINPYILSQNQRMAYLILRLKRISKKSIKLIKHHITSGKFEPLGYEVSFSDNGQFKPLTISLPTGQKVKLTGRIDRIDVLNKNGESFIRIIDYKSHHKDFNLTDVYYGLNLQLAVYMGAVLESGNENLQKVKKPAGMLYFKLDDPVVELAPDSLEEDIEYEMQQKLKMRGLLVEDEEIIKSMDVNIGSKSTVIPAELTKEGKLSASSSLATMEQFNMLIKHAKKVVKELSSLLLSGEIPIRPARKDKNNENTACAYCDYKSICAFEGDNFNDIFKLKAEEVYKKISGNDGNAGN